MKAGKYALISSERLGYIEVSEDSTSGKVSVITSSTVKGRHYVTVAGGQCLSLTNCTAVSIEQAIPAQPVDGYLLQGVYKVEFDLPAGEYKVIVTLERLGSLMASYNSMDSASSAVVWDVLKNNRYITLADGHYLSATGGSIQMN